MIFLLACRGGGEILESPPPAEDSREGTEIVDSIGDQSPADTDWIFDPGTIHEIVITLPEESWEALEASPYDKVEATFSMDGLEMGEVGVKLAGKIGSYRALSGKPKFRIDFNAFVEDRRFYGLEALALNNSVQDCSFLKEALGMRVMRDLGIAASRTSWAHLTVNGEDFGFYIVMEYPDEVFLRDNFDQAGGNLYDGKYVWYGGYNYTLLDFTPDLADLYQLEEGTDVGRADVWAVVNAVQSAAGTPGWLATTEPVVDWDHLHRYLAAEQLMGHNDGYAMNRNNYRFYFDPALDGRFVMVPWDFDNSLLYDYEWGFSWQNPSGVLAYYCFKDAACAADHAEAVRAVVGEVDTPALLAWWDELQALTWAQIQADPRKECSTDTVAYYQSLFRERFANAEANLAASWGVQ